MEDEEDHMDADDTEVQRYCNLLLKDESGVLRSGFRFFPSANNEYQRKGRALCIKTARRWRGEIEDAPNLRLPLIEKKRARSSPETVRQIFFAQTQGMHGNHFHH